MMQSHVGTHTMIRSADSSATPIKVLIIEGHPAVRSALYKRLSATPLLEVVESVGDISAALSWMEPLDPAARAHIAPDVIVLGLQSGNDSDLFYTVQEIKSLIRYPAAVVVLASYADEVERVLFQTAGVKCYLLKHINSQQLIREIQKAAAEPIDGVS